MPAGQSHPPASNATIAYAPAVAMPAPTAAPAAGYDCSGGSDPYGFASILNGLRAAAGLHPVAYDPGLSSWASQNNAWNATGGLVITSILAGCRIAAGTTPMPPLSPRAG